MENVATRNGGNKETVEPWKDAVSAGPTKQKGVISAGPTWDFLPHSTNLHPPIRVGGKLTK